MANPVICAEYEAFGIGDGDMHPGQLFMGYLPGHSFGVMVVSEGGKVVVDVQSVGMDMLAGRDLGGYGAVDPLFIHAAQGPDGQKSGVIAATFHHHRHRRLVGRASAPLFASDRATEIGVVHFDGTGQGIARIALSHGLAELVQHSPGRFVAKLKLLAQTHGGNAALILANQINRPKPLEQRGASLMENGAGGKGNLVMALGTLLQTAGCDS